MPRRGRARSAPLRLHSRRCRSGWSNSTSGASSCSPDCLTTCVLRWRAYAGRLICWSRSDTSLIGQITTDVEEIDRIVGQFLHYVRAGYRETPAYSIADEIVQDSLG